MTTKKVSKKMLGAKAIHERNAKNAMSFISLILSFIVEITFLILMSLFSFANNWVLTPITVRKFTLTAIALVEVKTSKNLR